MISGDLWERARFFSRAKKPLKTSQKLSSPLKTSHLERSPVFFPKIVIKPYQDLSNLNIYAECARSQFFFPETGPEMSRAQLPRCKEPGFFSRKCTTKPNKPQQTSTSSAHVPIGEICEASPARTCGQVSRSCSSSPALPVYQLSTQTTLNFSRNR